MEQRKMEFSLLQQMFPIARTPLDKRTAKSLSNYSRDVGKTLNSLTPWQGTINRYEQKKRQLSKLGVKSGEVVVLGNTTKELSNTLFKDAKVINV
jgi:23S rRNA C2498 (ribose-2'-O)-methylase RlmM